MFMGLAIDSRIKTSDVGIPLLHTEFKVSAVEHNSTVEQCYGCLTTSKAIQKVSSNILYNLFTKDGVELY